MAPVCLPAGYAGSDFLFRRGTFPSDPRLSPAGGRPFSAGSGLFFWHILFWQAQPLAGKDSLIWKEETKI